MGPRCFQFFSACVQLPSKPSAIMIRRPPIARGALQSFRQLRSPGVGFHHSLRTYQISATPTAESPKFGGDVLSTAIDSSASTGKTRPSSILGFPFNLMVFRCSIRSFRRAKFPFVRFVIRVSKIAHEEREFSWLKWKSRKCWNCLWFSSY